MRKYKHLFFDLDHTLWDFETNSKQTLSSLLAKYELDKNLSTEKFISDYWIHNKRLWDAYEKSEIDQKTLRFERFNLSLKDQGLMDSRLAELMSQEYLALLPFRKTLMNGAIEILDYLKPNYILHLITNGFEEIQMLKIRNCAIEEYFVEIVTSEKAGYMKPEKGIFEFALNRSGANREESLMIGDNHHADIFGAHQMGIDQVWFNPKNEKIEFVPTVEIAELATLKSIL